MAEKKNQMSCTCQHALLYHTAWGNCLVEGCSCDEYYPQPVGEPTMAHGELAPIWKVTRFCCTSGMCIECRAVAHGTKRKRIVHADKLTKPLAERMAAGWSAYDAKVEAM